jgi:hypothetical protein
VRRIAVRIIRLHACPHGNTNCCQYPNSYTYCNNHTVAYGDSDGSFNSYINGNCCGDRDTTAYGNAVTQRDTTALDGDYAATAEPLAAKSNSRSSRQRRAAGH